MVIDPLEVCKIKIFAILMKNSGYFLNNNINSFGGSRSLSSLSVRKNSNIGILVLGMTVLFVIIFFLILINFSSIDLSDNSNNEEKENKRIECKINSDGHVECTCLNNFVGPLCKQDGSEKCSDSSLCNNRGTPYVDPDDDTKCKCFCYDRYLGTKCEMERADVYQVAFGENFNICCRNGFLCGPEKEYNDFDGEGDKACLDALYNVGLRLSGEQCMCDDY